MTSFRYQNLVQKCVINFHSHDHIFLYSRNLLKRTKADIFSYFFSQNPKHEQVHFLKCYLTSLSSCLDNGLWSHGNRRLRWLPELRTDVLWRRRLWYRWRVRRIWRGGLFSSKFQRQFKVCGHTSMFLRHFLQMETPVVTLYLLL